MVAIGLVPLLGAGEAFLIAVGTLEKAHAASPNANAHSIDLASGWTQYADFLRNQDER